MVTKFFKEFAGTKQQFQDGGYETTLANNIVFIKDEANNGAGACIFTRGMYFADFASLIGALAFVKGINVGGTNYNAAQGGGYVKFEAADPATVVYVDNNGVKIGLSEAFVNAHNAVIADVATIKADYLKASDKQELTQLVNDKDAAMKSYVDSEIAKVASSEAFTALEGRVSTLEGKVSGIEADYLKGADKEELQGKIDAVNERVTNEAPVTMETTAGEGEILNVYTFKQNGKTIGVVNTRKELVVTGGEIVEKEGVKYLSLSIANQETPVEIPVSELVDVYTAGDYVNISEGNVISVDKAGIIEGLATDANAQSYANAAKEAAIADAEGKIEAAIASEVTRSNKYADDAVAAAEGRVDTKLANYSTSEQVDGKISSALEPYAKTADVNAELAKKANAADVYTKTEADTLLGGKANVGDSYTKAEADALLGAKANAASVYTKTQVDGLVEPKADKTYVDEELAKKANSGDSYLKSETYTQAEVQALFDLAFSWERIEA